MGQVLRVKLKAFDSRLLDKSTREVVDIAIKNGIKLSGPIPLPTKLRKYIVNKSPHKDRNSREQFGLKVHKRLILLSGFDNKVVKIFMNVQLAAGVDLEILVL